MASYFDPLWVVTSYYNPAGYKRRLQNFRAFRRLINAPLMVVELARPGRHQLTEADGDRVLSLTGEDRIWQKERLLNIGIAELPRHVRYVAWVDCDVVFGDEEWVGKAKSRLDRSGGLLQLFDTLIHLPKDADVTSLSPQTCGEYAPLFTGVSIGKSMRAAAFDENDTKTTRAQTAPDSASYDRAVEGHNCYGVAWSALRDNVQACGLYDRSIIGGGDALHVFAALSRLDDHCKRRAHTEKQKQDAASWARMAESAGLFSNIDSMQQNLYHMWHGDSVNRNYRGRYEILARHGFDPTGDIQMSVNGTWRWSNPQSELAREVEAYFFARREDGID
jgi:hypothetical protein